MKNFIKDLKELLQKYGDGYMTFGFIIIYIVLIALSVILLIVVYSNETLDDEFLNWLKISLLIGFYISVFLKFVNSEVNKSTTKSSTSCEYSGTKINPIFSNSVIMSTLKILIKNLITMSIIYFPVAAIASLLDIIISITKNNDNFCLNNIIGLILSSLESNMYIKIVAGILLFILILFIIFGGAGNFFIKKSGLSDKFVKIRDISLAILNKFIRPLIISAILIMILQYTVTNWLMYIFSKKYTAWALITILIIFAIIMLKICGIKGIKIIIGDSKQLYYNKIEPLILKLQCWEAKTNQPIINSFK